MSSVESPLRQTTTNPPEPSSATPGKFCPSVVSVLTWN
jgi:hypothetical protein